MTTVTSGGGYTVRPQPVDYTNDYTVGDITYIQTGPNAGGYSRGGVIYMWNGNGYSAVNNTQTPVAGTGSPGTVSTSIPQAAPSAPAASSEKQDAGPQTILEPTGLEELDTQSAKEILKNTRLKKAETIYEIQIDPAIDDKITNFNPKKSLLVFDKDELIGPITKKPTLKTAKTQQQFERLQISETTFIYRQDTGQLLLNANGVESGLGENGGILATIDNKAKLTIQNISFYSHG